MTATMPAATRVRVARESKPCIDGGGTHARESLGLDINAKDELVSVRRCVWCQAEQERLYGSERRSWRDRLPVAG